MGEEQSEYSEEENFAYIHIHVYINLCILVGYIYVFVHSFLYIKDWKMNWENISACTIKKGTKIEETWLWEQPMKSNIWNMRVTEEKMDKRDREIKLSKQLYIFP